MDRKMGMAASGITALMVILFAASMGIGWSALSYGSCLVLGWAYVLVTCAFAAFAPVGRKGLALGGVAIAVLYALLTGLVYFTQLTTVAYGAADGVVLQMLTYQPGSWAFGVDLFGYGVMGLSTFLIGLSLVPRTRADKVMRVLLLVHGVFFPVCVVLPMCNVFKGSAGAHTGEIALFCWCVYFVPVMLLTYVYFRRQNDRTAFPHTGQG